MLVKELKGIDCTTDILLGKGVEFDMRLPQGRIVLVVSPSLNKVFLNKFVAHYKEKGVLFMHVHKKSGEPWSSEVDCAFKSIGKDFLGVVGIGGGSVLDFAKALAILGGNGGVITDYEFGDRDICNTRPLWMVPTTCGSGSEVTQYCVINNSKTGRKFTLSDASLKPQQAAINPAFLRNLPDQVKIETGLDAFTHCLESLLNCERNSDVDLISRKGLRIAFNILPIILGAKLSYKELEKLSVLSLLGGISISHNRTGLIHTLSVAFAPFILASHGMLNSHLIPYALNYSIKDYNGVLKNVVSDMMDTDIESDHKAYEMLLSWLWPIIESHEISIKSGLSLDCEKIVDRICQDQGLGRVTYGPIDRVLLTDTVKKVIGEIR